MGFALMDAVNVKITKLGETTPTITIDYANKSSLKLDGEVKFAKKGGVNAISFPGSKSGTFDIEAEIVTNEWLALSLGGELVTTNNKITVKGVSEVSSYKIEGTFNVRNEDGTITLKDIVFYNVSPKTNAELTFSTEEISGFKIEFDLMADGTGVLMTMEDHVAA